MALKLVVEIGGDSLSEFEYCFESGQVTLGRNTACNIQVPLDAVSDKHLSFVREGDAWLVADRGSTNGTRLNGDQLEPDRFRPLANGDRIQIVDVVIRVEVGSGGDVTSSEKSGELARRMVESILARSPHAPNQAYLEVLTGRDVGAKRSLGAHRPTRVVGPTDDGARGWRLSDPGVTGEIRVEPVGSGFRVYGPGVVVNGEEVGAEGLALRSGARIAVGSTILLFFDPLEAGLRAEERPAPRKRPTRPTLAQADSVERRATAKVVTLEREPVGRTEIGLPLERGRDRELAGAGPNSDQIELETRQDGWGFLEMILLGLAVVLFLGAVGVFLLLFDFL